MNRPVSADLLVHLRRARFSSLGSFSARFRELVGETPSEFQRRWAVPGPPQSPDMIAAINRALDDGTMHGLGMNVDDCRKTCEDLRAKGVEFVQEPQERPYGVEAVARDNSGNWMVLVEPRPFTPEDFA